MQYQSKEFWNGCGLVAGIIALAVGGMLDFSVSVSPDQGGLQPNTVGVILMIVSVFGVMLSRSGPTATSVGRRRTVMVDGRGHVAPRQGTAIER